MIQLFQPKYEVEECLAALRGVLESGWTGTGPKCAELETAWKDYTGASRALFLNSATAALHLALRLLNLEPGSKVATTPITFVSTNAVILYEGLTPVFCDVNRGDFSLDADSVIAAQKAGAKAVLWVHYGGQVSPEFYKLMKAVDQMTEEFYVIEDCAHAAGACYVDGSRVGSRSDTLSCFSFQAVKNLPTFDSGMLCFPEGDEDWEERARRLSWLGIDKSTFARSSDPDAKEVYKWRYDVPELGWKYNGNDVAAAIALVQLKYLDRDNAYRRRINEWYREALTSQGTFIDHDDGSAHHLVTFRTGARDRIIARLKAAGIAPGVHYLPNFQFEPFSKFYTPGSCPVAELASDVLISLPNHLRLTKADVHAVAKEVNACFL